MQRWLPRSTSFNVSPRKPSRSVSSGITSSGGMLPRLTDAPNSLMNHAWAAFVGASKTMFAGPTTFAISLDQLGAHAARRIEDAGGATLAGLGDHLPGARLELLVQPLRPLVDRVLDARVLRPDLGEHCEVTREIGDQLELALARDVDRAVGDLDVCEPELDQPLLVLVEFSERVDDLEERPADHDGLVAQHVELALEVVRDVRGAPAELDDRDVIAGDLEHVLPRARAEALVDHVREADVLAEAELKGGHRAPPASPWRASARRGTASCRARRCRR